jgi:nitrite reductase/ring-hydroxylating ferredoxin subunit
MESSRLQHQRPVWSGRSKGERGIKVKLAEESEVTEGALTPVDFFGRPAFLLRSEGQVKGYLDICMHLGGPLQLQDGQLQCQWHHACFEARNGKATCAPAPRDSKLIRLPLNAEGGDVYYVYGE